MREIVFDTETTGLDANQDRIIELGGIELFKRFPTGRVFHHFINPQGRPINSDAQAVHGISMADLQGKPTFDAIAEEFLVFIDGAKLVAHNAGFDIGFLNAEFARLGRPLVGSDRVVDTLAIARRKHPMGPNSLDALCRRYGIDNSHRTKHGALLDSELLAEVYLELMGGRQPDLTLTVVTSGAGSVAGIWIAPPRPRPLAPRLTPAEAEAHAAFIATLGPAALWMVSTPAG